MAPQRTMLSTDHTQAASVTSLRGQLHGLGLGLIDTTAHSEGDTGYAKRTRELRAALLVPLPGDKELTALSKMLNEALERARAKDGEAASTGWIHLFNDLDTDGEAERCLRSFFARRLTLL